MADNKKTIDATDASFQKDVLDSSAAVLVDFWAPWCGPCKAVGPILEDLAAARSDVRLVKVNVDDCPQLAAQYNVRAIPTICLFRNGEVAKTKVGAVGKAELAEMLDA